MSEQGWNDDQQVDVETLFHANLGLIERVIDGVCHHANLRGADAEDFASNVKLALIENDYAILGAWQRRASLGGYLVVVVKRMLFDERSRTMGRFEPSAEARRGGEAAVVLEKLVHRDGRPVEQAIPIIRSIDSSLSRQDIERMLSRLPERAPRPRPASIDDIDVASTRASDGAETRLADREVERLSDRASRVVRRALEALSQQDRTIVRMHFGSGISVADISRMLRLPQRPLYRRIEASLAHLRRELVAEGIAAGTAEGLIGSAVQSLDFGFGAWKNGGGSQSINDGGPDTGGGA